MYSRYFQQQDKIDALFPALLIHYSHSEKYWAITTQYTRILGLSSSLPKGAPHLDQFGGSYPIFFYSSATCPILVLRFMCNTLSCCRLGRFHQHPRMVPKFCCVSELLVWHRSCSGYVPRFFSSSAALLYLSCILKRGF